MNYKKLSNFQSFVQGNFHKKGLKVDDITQAIDCSKSYLHEILTYRFNYSTMQYVEYYRILKAVELLLKGEKKFYPKLGFSSSASYCRSFYKIFDICSGEFLEKAAGADVKIIIDFTSVEDPKEKLEEIKKLLNNKKDKKRT